jgi:hypothetical protein
MRGVTLEPVRYEVIGHPFRRHRVFIEKRGVGRWVCTTGTGDALNGYGEFEYEPLPSNRSDEFIHRTRFTGAEEALGNFVKQVELERFGPHW